MLENVKCSEDGQKKITKTNVEDLIKGYITGFFDAEGMIRLEEEGTSRISIKQTYKPVLDEINLRFKGTVDSHPKKGSLKQAFRLRILHDDVIRFLEYIYPNLIEKRKQAELMLYYLKKVKPPKRDYWKLSETQKQQQKWLKTELERLKHEKYDERELINYDNEIKKLKIPKDIREGKQAILFGDITDLYKELGIDDNKEIEDYTHYIPDMSEDVSIGYVAGFFDGEGYVGISKGKKDSFTLRAAVTNSNFDILNLYKNRYGGKIRPKSIKNAKDYYKKLWLWENFNNDILTFLKDIYPYTKVKKEQIYYAINFQEWHNSIGIIRSLEQKKKAEYYRLKLVELKKETGEDDEDDCDDDACKEIMDNAQSVLEF